MAAFGAGMPGQDQRPLDHRLTVLVVEDEPLIRMDVVDLLEEAGFTVLDVDSGEGALAVLERHPGIGALFTDVDMPGRIDGLALAHEVSRRWPSVRIVVTSGKVNIGIGDLPSGGRFFPKPYSFRQLTQTLSGDGAGA